MSLFFFFFLQQNNSNLEYNDSLSESEWKKENLLNPTPITHPPKKMNHIVLLCYSNTILPDKIKQIV